MYILLSPPPPMSNLHVIMVPVVHVLGISRILDHFLSLGECAFILFPS